MDKTILRPCRLSDALWRSTLETNYEDSCYTVEIDYFDARECIRLYRDGTLIAEKRSPACFTLENNARIEVALSLYGTKYARIVYEDGTSRALAPCSGTIEHARMRLRTSHPAADRILSTCSWGILALGLTTSALAGIQSITNIAHFPLALPTLPSDLQTVLGALALAAALERALNMKYHPLLDD